MASAVATLVMGLTACGGSDTSQPTGPNDPEPGPFTEVACTAFTLGASSGMPLETISMGQLPTSFSLPAAAVSLPDGTPGGLAYVLAGETGNLELLVPLHPTAPMVGGPVTLTFTDGTRACAPVDFAIQAMPPADGEFLAVLDLLQEVLTEQAATFDATPEQLVSEPLDELAPGLWPLALAQTILDDPANSESLRAVADGALGGETLDWLNRILARTDVRSELENPPPDLTSGKAPAFSSASAFGCLPRTVGSSAALLNDCMKASAEALRATEGISARVAADIVAAFGVAAQVRLPVAGAVETVLGAMSWGIYSQRLKAAALYPSAFTAMNVQVDRPSFAEDEEKVGKVSYAEVYATNLGYNLADEIIDGVKEAVSLAVTAEKFDFTHSTSEETPTEQVSGTLQNQISSMIEEKLRGLDIEAFDIAPQLFGAVNVTDPLWTQARVAIGQSIEVVEGTTYRPILHGTSTLSVRTTDGEFGGRQIAEQVDVDVKTILVIFTPSEKFAAPSDPANIQFETFEVRIENSVHPDMVDLDLSDHPEQGSVEIRPTAGGNIHFVDYRAPQNPDFDKKDLLVVRHTAESGARKNGPERTGIGTVRFAGIDLLPVPGCVAPDQDVQLNWTLSGLDPAPELVWTASAGDVEDGVFTAPGQMGTVTITVEVADSPELTDSIEVTVGDCVCSFTLQVGSNPTYVSQPGDTLIYSSSQFAFPNQPYAINGFILRGVDGSGVFSLRDPAQAGPGPGVYALSEIAGGLGFGGADDSYIDYEEVAGSVTIFEYEPGTRLSGEATGLTRENREIEPALGPQIPVHMTFEWHSTEEYSIYGLFRACGVP